MRSNLRHSWGGTGTTPRCCIPVDRTVALDPVGCAVDGREAAQQARATPDVLEQLRAVRGGDRELVADLMRGVWRENPVLVSMLGLCPTLAVTNTVANSLAMGIATMAIAGAIKNAARQETYSTSNPPRTGPTAIARPHASRCATS